MSQPTSVFVNSSELVRMGQQAVPASAFFCIQTALGPVELGVQRAAPQGLSIRPVHRQHKHTRRGKAWKTQSASELH